MEHIDSKIIVGVIAALSAIGGATITGFFKTLSSRQKILEVKEAYRQRLQDNYLENAREYTESVYVPISILLSRLTYGFREFRAEKGSDREQEALAGFITLIDQVSHGVSELMDRGAGAFLTAELDERLQSFCSFLQESRDATAPTLRMIIGFSLPFFGGAYRDEAEKRMTGWFARSLWSPRLSFSLGGLGLSYEASEILAAPPISKDFEERFVRDSHIINVLIKEVTLGAKAKHNIGSQNR